MDVFKFTNPKHPMRMEYGEIINGLTKKTWVERYAEAGEFSFTAPASAGIQNKLPIGSFVSHTNSTEIMIVENHEINEDFDQETQVIISGRGFETILERVIIGLNKTFPTIAEASDYTMPYDVLWTQIKNLIQRHIYKSYVTDPNNAIPYIEVINKVSASGTSSERSVQQSDLYSTVIGLIQEAEIGIKVVRPGSWSPVTTSYNIGLVLHIGANKQNSVTFSYSNDEISSADYLWSNQQDKNCAFVYSTWLETVVLGSQIEQDRRWLMVDASDIDNNYESPPSDANTLIDILNKMRQRGFSQIGQKKPTSLTKVELDKETITAVYGKDYNLGDLISITGNYNQKQIQRVIEYVEIEDETGRSAYPTLADPL